MSPADFPGMSAAACRRPAGGLGDERAVLSSRSPRWPAGSRLDGDEARHLRQGAAGPESATRSRSSTAAAAHGRGGWRTSVAARSSSRQASLASRFRRRTPAVTLAVALPKGERQKWLVEKLTELGVATARAAGDRAGRGRGDVGGDRADGAGRDRGLQAMRPRQADGDRRAGHGGGGRGGQAGGGWDIVADPAGGRLDRSPGGGSGGDRPGGAGRGLSAAENWRWPPPPAGRG